ncbi:MAG: TetR/AcrR family transcriptional regulator [Lachnospiraceae bacterium]|nr:TetR/AcrR family transcriptional regulator [Lachnospiraceae bacterium]
MSKEAYHHGNLKQELIERGLEFIDQNGVESLSMRKLAILSGVSSAAPYAHFENKEAFLAEVQNYITERFVETLRKTYESCHDRQRVLLELGKSYVLFFDQNPLYYSFLFSHGDIDLNHYPPFQMFQSIASRVMKELHGGKMDEYEIHNKTLAMWAMVHGLAQLYTLPAFRMMEGQNAEQIENILSSVEI